MLATEAQCFAFYQCQFEAPYPKPTRILTTLPYFKDNKPPYTGMPSFSKAGSYLGPLPAQCSHGGKHEPLIGKDQSTGNWKTAPAANYPSAMCKWLAEAIAHSFNCLGQSLQAASHPFPPPFPSSGLDSAPRVSAKVTPSGPTSQNASPPSSHPSSGLGPASHPRSGLGPIAPRVRTECAQHGQQDTATGEAGVTASGLPESFAEQLLELPSCRRADIEKLFDMLPKELPPRQEEGQPGGTSFSTGCYSKGGITGLRHNTSAYPLSTKLLARFAAQTFPSISFTTLFDGVRTPMHRDSRNGPHPNGVCPVSHFTGGQIWVEEEGGASEMDTPKGKLKGMAQSCFRCTLPWEGRRLVLVAYVVAGLERLSSEHKSVVSGLGFKLPVLAGAGDETSEVHLKVPDKPTSVPFRPELCGNRGAPLLVEWERKETPLTDGFGLCSPTRWPCDRGHSLSIRARAFANRMHSMALTFVRQRVADPERLCHALLIVASAAGEISTGGGFPPSHVLQHSAPALKSCVLDFFSIPQSPMLSDGLVCGLLFTPEVAVPPFESPKFVKPHRIAEAWITCEVLPHLLYVPSAFGCRGSQPKPAARTRRHGDGANSHKAIRSALYPSAPPGWIAGRLPLSPACLFPVSPKE